MSDQDLTQTGVATSGEPAVPLDTALAEAIERQRAARKLAGEQAAGLRALADMIEANPELSAFASLGNLYAFHVKRADDQAALARAALRHGAKVDKDIWELQHNLILRWGPVGAMVLANRGDVCERVVVAVEMITEKVPDPVKLAEVPLVEVTNPVEQVEWVCRPLLAAESTVDGA